MIELPFRDRHEAGCLLGAELAGRNLTENMIVLALPRGGVPVGWAVANALRAPLDVVVVRKLGVPWRSELAMGAIAGGSTMVLDEDLIQELGISREQVDAVVSGEREESERREKLYRADRPAPDLKGRTVLLIDDGLATGSTMVAAARHVRSFRPTRTIVAVPVASRQACRRLRTETDFCVCLVMPEPFIAVGEWYDDFRQVSDTEVSYLLDKSYSAVRSENPELKVPH